MLVISRTNCKNIWPPPTLQQGCYNSCQYVQVTRRNRWKDWEVGQLSDRLATLSSHDVITAPASSCTLPANSTLQCSHRTKQAFARDVYKILEFYEAKSTILLKSTLYWGTPDGFLTTWGSLTCTEIHMLKCFRI